MFWWNADGWHRLELRRFPAQTFVCPTLYQHTCKTRRTLGGSHILPTKLFPRLAVNKTILKPRVAAATGAQYIAYTWDFPNVIKFRVAAHAISEKAIRFRHPDYNPDRAQKLISSSMSRHLLTRNISSKCMHAFLSNLAIRQSDRQTDKWTRANAFTSSFVGGI